MVSKHGRKTKLLLTIKTIIMLSACGGLIWANIKPLIYYNYDPFYVFGFPFHVYWPIEKENATKLSDSEDWAPGLEEFIMLVDIIICLGILVCIWLMILKPIHNYFTSDKIRPDGFKIIIVKFTLCVLFGIAALLCANAGRHGWGLIFAAVAGYGLAGNERFLGKNRNEIIDVIIVKFLLSILLGYLALASIYFGEPHWGLIFAALLGYVVAKNIRLNNNAPSWVEVQQNAAKIRGQTTQNDAPAEKKSAGGEAPKK